MDPRPGRPRRGRDRAARAGLHLAAREIRHSHFEVMRFPPLAARWVSAQNWRSTAGR
jgi:hypothetical protein